MIDLRQLKNILLLAKYKNFGKAAEAGNITQPALSISIKKAEDYFGNALFTRKSRMIELTAQGRIAVDIASKMLDTLDRGKVDIVNMNNLDKGIVHFGLDAFLSKPLVPSVISSINKKHPNISFYVNVNPWYNIIDDLRKGNLDFIITVFSKKTDFADFDLILEEIKLPEPNYYVRKGHPLTKKDVVNGRDIKKYPWVGNLVSPSYENWLIAATELEDKVIEDGKFLASISDSDICTDIILESDAIGAVSMADLTTYIEKDLVEVLDVNWPIPHIEATGVIISMRDRKFSPACKLLLEEIKKHSKKW